MASNPDDLILETVESDSVDPGPVITKQGTRRAKIAEHVQTKKTNTGTVGNKVGPRSAKPPKHRKDDLKKKPSSEK